MAGHRFRKRSVKEKAELADANRKEADAASAHDIISYLRSTRGRVGAEAKLEGRSEGARAFTQQVGSISDRVHESRKRRLLSLAGAAAAAYMAVSPVAFAGQRVHESGYSKQDVAIITKFVKSNAKYSAKGEDVTKGAATNEIVGMVNINKLKGYSSEMLSGGRAVNGASVQLNTYVHLINNNGKGEWLWVQDGVQIFIHGDKKSETPLYTYGSISEIFKDSVRFDVQAIEGKPVTQQEFNSLKLSGLAGKGKIAESAGVMPTYLYADYSPSKENGRWTISGGDTRRSPVIRFALDIRVTEKQNVVYLNFGIASPGLKKEVTFDTVSYRVQGLKSAKIEFGRLHDTGLVITGIGGGSYFHAEEIRGFLSVGEKKDGAFIPLAVSGNADWSTGESTVGVHSVKLNSHTVELVTAKMGKNAHG